jgi:hypothetical protein
MCTVHADNQIPSLSKHDLPCFIKKQPHLYKDKDQVGKERGLMGRQHKHTQGFFFSAEISEISPKTGSIGDHRYFLIPNEIFRYSKNMFKF